MAYNNVFQKSRPYNNNQADPPSSLAEYHRRTLLILEERIGDFIHGLTDAETNELLKGFKKLLFRSQSAAPETDATGVQVYAKTVNAVIEIFVKFMDGTELQITSGGKLKIDGAIASTLLAVETKTGTATSTVTDKLSDSAQTFVAGDVGSLVHNTTDDTYAVITAVDTAILISLSADIFTSGEAYEVIPMPTETNELVTKAYADGIGWRTDIRATKSVTQVLGALATLKLLFETETYDIANEFDDSKFTPIMAGDYLVDLDLWLLPYANQGGIANILHIYKNGVSFVTITGINLTPTVNNIKMVGKLSLVPGDYIEIYLTRPQGAGSVNFHMGGGGLYESSLEIKRVN